MRKSNPLLESYLLIVLSMAITVGACGEASKVNTPALTPTPTPTHSPTPAPTPSPSAETKELSLNDHLDQINGWLNRPKMKQPGENTTFPAPEGEDTYVVHLGGTKLIVDLVLRGRKLQILKYEADVMNLDSNKVVVLSEYGGLSMNIIIPCKNNAGRCAHLTSGDLDGEKKENLDQVDIPLNSRSKPFSKDIADSFSKMLKLAQNKSGE